MSRYIGARYVPKFMGVFDPTQAYENLCVVDNGSGTSYISKITVPPGSSLTDPEYWAVYGAASGAIISLQDQIDAIVNDFWTPEYYGAAGDGVTDDVTAIQACLNANDITILNNSYYISNPITIPEGHIVIGKGEIISDQRDFIVVMDNNTAINGISFSDTLTANASSGSTIYAKDKHDLSVTNCHFETIGNGCCVCFEHCDHITVDNNTIKDYGHSGIKMIDSCRYISIQFNDVYNARYTGGEHTYPICFSGYQLSDHGPARFAKVNYNRIEEINHFWEGIDSHGARDYEVIGNYIKGCRYGIQLGSAATSGNIFTDANTNAIINNNDIDVEATGADLCYGIMLACDVGVTAKGVQICGNNIKGVQASNSATAASAAITLRPDGAFEGVDISGNVLDVTKMHGVTLDGGKMSNISIKNNYIKHISGGLSFYCFDISAMTSYDLITLENNNCDPTNDPTTARFFIGPDSVAPNSGILTEYRNNNDNGLAVRQPLYDTSRKAALPNVAKAIGGTGQFIPSTAGGTLAGWYCQSPGTWLSIDGTIVP